ncbi:MAG: PIG-L family deacetylase [Anaerolineae bacterium]|nr:PIG-L family deacetylase [Thermoflexales bacterium]MDW8395534.1 PIG-L family deacetylase [Anaerolineae bacterium]
MILFIAPHLDDVALSCGGLVWQLTQRGIPVTIATVCTADPPVDELSEAALREHKHWGLGDQPYRVRRIEDQQACARLGAQPVHLGLLDAIYRRAPNGAPLYSDTVIGVSVHPEDWQTQLSAIGAALVPLLHRHASVYCPLAIGGHVDHILTRAAVESALPQEARLIYYEDFPYVVHLPALDESTLVEGLLPFTVWLDERATQARLEAIACYSSQLAAVFGDPSSAEAQVRRYLSQIGGERYWQPIDAFRQED